MSIYRYTQTLDKDLYLRPFEVATEARSNPAIRNLVALSIASLFVLSAIFILIFGILISKSGFEINWVMTFYVVLGFFIGRITIYWAFLKNYKVSGLVNWLYGFALLLILTYTFSFFFSPSTWQKLIDATYQLFGTTYDFLRLTGLGFAFGVTTWFFSVNVTSNVAWVVVISLLNSSELIYSTDGLRLGYILLAIAFGLETHLSLATSSWEKTRRAIYETVVVSIIVWMNYSRFGDFDTWKFFELITLFFVVYLILLFRLPFYILELLINFFLYTLANSKIINPITSFKFLPIYWDEIIHLPLFGLDWYLELVRTQQKSSVPQFIQDISSSLYQRWAIDRAVVELTIGDIEASNNLVSIAQVAQTLSWLPPSLPAEITNVLPHIRKIAEHAHAALLSDTLYNKEIQLQQSLQQTRELMNSLSMGVAQRSTRLSGALSIWLSVFQNELTVVESNEIIPNVYVAGLPLDKDSNVFKGRRDLFQMLESELSTPSMQRPTLLLFGARRTGKTSVLKQLPVRLGPSVVPAEIDLQLASTAQSVPSFLHVISEKIRSDIAVNSRLQITPLLKTQLTHEPYITFLDWIKDIELAIGDRWLLLAFDEYETLEKMLERKRIDEGMFQLIRGIIQHHANVSILFSGSHTFEDLSALWSNYLVNVRVLHVGALSDTEAIELLTTPIKNFPLKYESNVIEYILNTTGCQPYLLQSTGRELVNLLNEERTLVASLEDVEKAFNRVLTSSSAYFNELWTSYDMDDVQRSILIALAEAGSKIVASETLRSVVANKGNYRESLQRLVHRDVIKQTPSGYSFNSDLVRRWIERNKMPV
jgi:hypothetical protein